MGVREGEEGENEREKERGEKKSGREGEANKSSPDPQQLVPRLSLGTNRRSYFIT